MLTDGPTAREDAIIGEHFTYLQRLTEAGVALLCGRTTTTDAATFGIVVFTAESEDAAREIMENDPAVRLRVMKAELFPFRIALLHKNWQLEKGGN
jgi:uncharacterized protein YciI